MQPFGCAHRCILEVRWPWPVPPAFGPRRPVRSAAPAALADLPACPLPVALAQPPHELHEILRWRNLQVNILARHGLHQVELPGVQGGPCE